MGKSINPMYTYGLFHLVRYNKLEIVHCIYLGVSGYNLKKNCILLSEDLFPITYSADADEMLQYAAFHLGLPCLLKYLFRGLLKKLGV